MQLKCDDIKILDTPAILIDLDVVERNLREMQQKADKYGVSIRPHIKTHKIPELARMQMSTGACGITASKVSEAEVMAEAGLDDILIANQVVTNVKLERLALLSKKAAISVGLDSPEGARLLSDTSIRLGCVIDYLIEINSGLDRCGVLPGKPALDLYEQIRDLPSIRFKGIFTHAGHVYGKASLDKIREVSRSESRVMVDTAEAFSSTGIESGVVSVGSTPTMKAWEGCEGISEIRPGNYIFNDAMQVAMGVAGVDDCALTVLSTVISRPEPERAVIDAGSKVFALDKGGHGLEMVKGFGMVIGKNAVLERLSEEHGIMSVIASDGLEIGDKVRIIPNHACTVINLFDKAYGIRDGAIEKEFRVAARGKIL